MNRVLIAALTLILLAGCSGTAGSHAAYRQISAEEAKEMMDELGGEIVLDVREPDEYDAGHIPGAVLLPVDLIDEEHAAEIIPAKESVVLVYCHSGNRSKTAAAALAELGYTQVYEFGGIQKWPYEVE